MAIQTKNNFRFIILHTLIWCTQLFVNGKKFVQQNLYNKFFGKSCTTNFFTNKPLKIRADIALEYFLWGHMKDVFYAKKSKTNHSKSWSPLTAYREATRQQILF